MKVIETFEYFEQRAPISLFELSTAYEGDWDDCSVDNKWSFCEFELSTAYEGDWDLPCFLL